MKNDYVIMSDNMGDLPAAYYQDHHIPIMYLSYTMEEETYSEGHMQSDEEFYKRMRERRTRRTLSVFLLRTERHL